MNSTGHENADVHSLTQQIHKPLKEKHTHTHNSEFNYHQCFFTDDIKPVMYVTVKVYYLKNFTD